MDHPKIQELRELSTWSEGHVWCTPERHGAMTGIMKAQIDWVPLSLGAVRPTQGKTLAVMQVSGGSQSFNAVNQLRVLGRWMRMITIPNQSSVAKAYEQFDENGRMKPSPYYDRIVDVAEELVKFTLLTRGASKYLTDRYSERKKTAAKFADRKHLNEALQPEVEGRDLSSRQTLKDLEIGKPVNSNKLFRSCRWRCTRKREVLSESRMREICLSGSMSVAPCKRVEPMIQIVGPSLFLVIAKGQPT
jgi:NAD(P)H-dependent FMN reductase